MSGDDRRPGPVKPSEQRGGTTPGAEEARAKGEWAASAQDGVVPAELGGSDPAAGDRADATTHGGAEPPEGGEPDLKDVAAAARKADAERQSGA